MTGTTPRPDSQQPSQADSPDRRSVTPYEIHVPDSVLEETRARLRATRWADAVPGDPWRYGASIPYLRDLITYWTDEYDWRKAEHRLNSFPNFVTTVDGLDLHFWHVRGAKANSIPLLLLHGWPGSVVEFLDLIGPLTDPASHGAPEGASFDLIVPEIPGFGFGGKPSEPGWGVTRMAHAFDTLMHDVLGYDHYTIQGGDWGTLLGARAARYHPDHVAALHINMPFTPPYGDHIPSPEWQAHFQQLTGYLHVQSLIPDAFTLGLADSPLGTAAWIIEKFAAWSDNDGDLDQVFSKDTLLTNIQFYWATKSIVSATRIYREAALEDEDLVGPPRIAVPTGVAVFPKEPYRVPRQWLDGVYTIEHWREFDSGGHFAPLERPDDLLHEIRTFLPTRFGA
jgi:epoxide hydrolase